MTHKKNDVEIGYSRKHGLVVFIRTVGLRLSIETQPTLGMDGLE